MSDRAALSLKIVTATINLVTIATIFDETYKAIFDHLFATRFSKGRFFGPISIYFKTVKTNGRSILYFHYLVWLGDMTNLSNFQ